jgi:hypothetical protein
MPVRIHPLLLVQIALLCAGALSAQSLTVGTLFQREDTDSGYVLLVPAASTQTWLMDNCGREVHRWFSDAPPALSAYLLPDGSLLRSARISNDYPAGGSGGRIDRQDWNGLPTWTYTYSSDSGHQHHDILPLPNGNVLVLAWEKFSVAEAIARGRRPDLLVDELWAEKIIELRPTGPNSADIVWTWRLWDHLVQDRDPGKPNFGNPSDFPGRVDINYVLDSIPETWADWTHANSLDYHPELDQIVLSVRNFHELWIIDHSTTTEEAAGSSGGNSGRGGELLYRWGNPRAYGRGGSADQVFFQQHDATWIPPGFPGEGNLTVFNNGRGRPGGEYSSVEEIQPPLLPDGTYALPASGPYGPATTVWSYRADPPGQLLSKNLSGARRQSNGNTLICSGAEGRLLEVSPEGVLTWEYVCPVGPGGPISQGNTAVNNQLFRAIRYAPDYDGLSGRDLSPGAFIQFEAPGRECEVEPVPTGLAALPQPNTSSAFPNPFTDRLHITTSEPSNFTLSLYGPSGKLQTESELKTGGLVLQTADWPSGLYLLRITRNDGSLIHQQRLLRL